MSAPSVDAPRFEERLTGRIAREGYAFAAPLLPAAALLYWLTGAALAALLPCALAVGVLAFFRNPKRSGPEAEELVLAPADGRVLCVEPARREDGPALRIGIFLSIFDVHVNRAPVSGLVTRMERAGDSFLAAFRKSAPRHNVRLTLGLETESGLHVDVVQMTGLVARRIVCHPEVGQMLTRGARYGMIRFGSRTDVLLPAGSMPKVEKGDRVRGGVTVLAALPALQQEPPQPQRSQQPQRQQESQQPQRSQQPQQPQEPR